MSPRIAVLEHQESCPPALLGTWLREGGAELDVVRPHAGDALGELASYDGVVVLGGEMSANDDATVPWLGPLKEQLRVLVEAEVPLLGICLGHQLIATALGGRVAPNPAGQAVGLQPVGWTAEAATDRLFVHSAGARVLQWNNDVVVEAPERTTTLATAPDGTLQVARFGAAAWGTQAHPEVDVSVVKRWAETDYDAHRLRGIDQEVVLAELESAQEELIRAWRPVAQRFVELSGAGA